MRDSRAHPQTLSGVLAAKIDHAVTGPAGAARLAPFITSIPVTDIWITETVVLADAAVRLPWAPKSLTKATTFCLSKRRTTRLSSFTPRSRRYRRSIALPVVPRPAPRPATPSTSRGPTAARLSAFGQTPLQRLRRGNNGPLRTGIVTVPFGDIGPWSAHHVYLAEQSFAPRYIDLGTLPEDAAARRHD